MRLLLNIAVLGAGAGALFCCPQAWAAQPTKPIKECAKEYRVRQASLDALGVSASTFFHECWWHSRPGEATTLAASRDPRTRSSDPSSEAHRRPEGANRRVATNAGHRWKTASQRLASRRIARRRGRTRTYAEARFRHEVRMARHRPKTQFGLAASDRPLQEARSIADPLRARNADRASSWSGDRLNDAVDRTRLAVSPDALDGRRAWIGTAGAQEPRKMAAVIIGPLTEAAVKGSKLHCWDQGVLFVGRRTRWQQSLVCDGKVAWGAQTVWFEAFR